ncbi:MAG: endonuclease/exonuclease/phosphatase family protein, partial [Flavobacteriales bacterium]|nr:endonuclease/exonuclease/phosphatase family protein [Flavobacteriales bacterium]
NQCPPNYTPIDTTGKYNEFILQSDQLPEGWQWIADPSTPTNRKNETAYVRGQTYTSVIDHYAVSPNVVVEEVKVYDLDFQFSDHQPVQLRIRLN